MDDVVDRKVFADAAKSSLKNAERWIDDASMLIDKSSYGHSVSALYVAVEEMAKALICWHVGEGIMPLKNNRLVSDIFRFHKVKKQFIVGMCFMILLRAFHPRLRKGREPTGTEINIAWKFLREDVLLMEQMRQKATYVNLDKKTKEVETPEAISQDRAQQMLKGVEALFRNCTQMIQNVTESQKKDLKKIFESFPEEAWQTGELSLEMFASRYRRAEKMGY